MSSINASLRVCAAGVPKMSGHSAHAAFQADMLLSPQESQTTPSKSSARRRLGSAPAPVCSVSIHQIHRGTSVKHSSQVPDEAQLLDLCDKSWRCKSRARVQQGSDGGNSKELWANSAREWQWPHVTPEQRTHVGYGPMPLDWSPNSRSCLESWTGRAPAGHHRFVFCDAFSHYTTRHGCRIRCESARFSRPCVITRHIPSARDAALCLI
jgi:hypothetical protein